MKHPMLLPLALLALSSAALAQDGDGSDPLPASELPGSDSPESSSAAHVVQPHWQGARKKIQTFLVPLDEKARGPTARVAQALEAFQGSLAQYEVVDLGKALKVDATPEQAERVAEGRRLVAEGSLLFAGRGYADAALKYAGAIARLEKGLAALDALEYADVWARLGAVEALAGDDKASRKAFVNAARHDPGQKISGRAIDASAEVRMQGGRADVEALPTGTIEIETRPASARVMVDGELKGQSPVRVELPSGKHLIRLERAGFYPSAELVDVPAGKEWLHTVALKSTPRAADLYEVMGGAAEEAGRGEVASQTGKLAEKFGLDRMFVGSVAAHGSKVALSLALVDVQKHRQIGRASILLQADGTDADQIEEETRAAAKKLALADPGDAEPKPADAAAAADKAYAPAPAAGKQVAMPADEVDLAQRERKPAPPAETAKAEPAAAEQPKKKEEKKKKKKLKDVSGTEEWNTD